MEIKKRIKGYLELLCEIKDYGVSEETAMTVLQEVAKDQRMEEMRREHHESRNVNLATEKQIEWLKDLGVTIMPGLTRVEASRLIDETVEKPIIVKPRRIP